MDYQGNSHKAKEESEKPVPPEKHLVSVVTGEVITRKKPFGSKFKSIFFGGEFKEVVSYVTYERLLPGVRNILFDMIKDGAYRSIYGTRGGYNPRRDAIPTTSRVQYNNPVRRLSDPRMQPPTGSLPNQPPLNYRQNRREANEIILVSREEADRVLETMISVLEMYNVVSLADLYELLALPMSPIDQKWGWTYLTSANIKQVRDGYLLELPPMEEI